MKIHSETQYPKKNSLSAESAKSAKTTYSDKMTITLDALIKFIDIDINNTRTFCITDSTQ